jgi:hypothetical protein
MRKLAPALVLIALAIAAVAMPAMTDGAAPQTITTGQVTLRLSSTTPGATLQGNTLVCPPLSILSSSGREVTPCAITIESVGTIEPTAVIVDLTVTGITPAEASARKFAIDPQPGSMVYFEPTTQTLYSLSAAQLPATVHPAVVWGVNAGTPLDNGDLGEHLGVTYTVVAESLDGPTAPIATQTPFESFAGVTSGPGQNVTPPPTASDPRSSSDGSAPILLLEICALLFGLGLTAIQFRRRQVRR